mgnify:FL=1
MLYRATTKWAGLVWVWGLTLNTIKPGEKLILLHGEERVEIPYEEIKESAVRTKTLWNPLLKRNDTQYGFDINKLVKKYAN